MSAQCKYYFLAPTWHNHPKSGTLQLGNIMTDLKAPGPERPLYRGPPPPPPRLVDTPPDVGSEERTESYQTNFEFSTDRLRAGKFGIWTKFLSVLGLGVDLGYEWDDRFVSHSSRVRSVAVDPLQIPLPVFFVSKLGDILPIRRILLTSDSQ